MPCGAALPQTIVCAAGGSPADVSFPGFAMRTLSEVVATPKRELPKLLREGHPIDPTARDNTVYHGVSLGLPRWAERVSWKTFAKTFYRASPEDPLFGWNIRVEQKGIGSPTQPKVRKGQPWCFGYYGVTSSRGYKVPADYAHGLLIQYRFGPNAAFDPVNLVRDPLVALNPDDPSLLFGWSYVHLGRAVWTPSYFVLQAEGPITHVPAAMEDWGTPKKMLLPA